MFFGLLFSGRGAACRYYGAMAYLSHIPRIYDGLAYWLAEDPVFARLDIAPEDVRGPYYGPGFDGLVRIVLGQQISVQAAASLWERLHAGMPCVTPNAVMALDDEQMRGFGLSHQKARYIRGLAAAVRDGALVPEALAEAPDDDVYAALTALKGFGRWSADMYLMFGLARPDIFPAGDLGIQTGLQYYLGLGERPDAARAAAEKERFSPHATAASLLLWRLKAG